MTSTFGGPSATTADAPKAHATSSPLTTARTEPRIALTPGCPRSLSLRRACLELRGHLAEQVEPAGRDGVGDRARLAALLGRLPPVEPDPPRDDSARAFEEPPQVVNPAAQREGLLDHDRLAEVEPAQRRERLLALLLAGLGVKVDADEIERACNGLRHEPRGQARPVEAPVHHPDGDEVVRVGLAD